MNVTNSNFGFTEEAFLLNSLHEVIKVWSRGSGQASFDLNILDGSAELKLGFKLGHPGDLHCHPPPHQHVQEGGYQQPYQHQQPPRRRRKGQARRDRDRLRAQLHQAGLHPHPQAAATDAPEVILPFTGKLLPVGEKPHPTNHIPSTPAAASAVVSPATAATSVVNSPAASSAVSPPVSVAVAPAAARPVKLQGTPRTSQSNVNLAKKDLFPILQDQPSQASPAFTIKKDFQKKEDELWTKLFKL